MQSDEKSPAPVRLSALSAGSGDAHLYLVGRDGKVWTNSWPALERPDEPSGWSALGEQRFAQGASVIVLSNRLIDKDLFVLGRDRRLWNNCWVTDDVSKQWRGWSSLGERRFPDGASASAVSVRNRGDVAVFAIGAAGGMWQNYFPAPHRGLKQWSGWLRVGEHAFAPGASVSAISTGHAGDLSVLARGLDGKTWVNSTAWPVPHRPQDWSGWSALGERPFPPAARIFALRSPTSESGIWIIGSDNRLWSNLSPAYGRPEGWSS